MKSTFLLVWGGSLSLLLVVGDLTAADAQRPVGPVARVAQLSSSGSKTRSPADKTTDSVSLTIDYGDGFQKRYSQAPWQEEMTVGDLLRHAQQHRRGIDVTIRGRGKMSLLVQIDDLKNQGGRGLNWIFRVNGKLSDRSFEVHSLKAGDAVLWKFDEYR